MTKIAELRSKTNAELESMVNQLRKDQFKLRLARSQDPLQIKSHQFSVLRKQIARIKTIITENRKDV